MLLSMPSIHTALLVFSFVTWALCQSLNVSVPLDIDYGPGGTTPRFESDHIGFSLEGDRWLDWAGSTSRNEFFYNILMNIKFYTNTPPPVRVGANSEDRTHFNPNTEFAQLQFPAPSSTIPYPEARTIVVGGGYYRATRFLPPNSRVTWGLNLGSNNLTAAYLMAQSIAKTFSDRDVLDQNIRLEGIEIGNEPDLYGNNGLRASGYNISTYISEWTAIANNVTSVLGISQSSYHKFLAPSLATTSRSTSGWSPQSFFVSGILNSSSGALINTISQHKYSGSFCTGSPALLQDLMTKANIRGNISILAPDIAATRARGLKYILGETNSFSCHGAPGVSNVAGAALWTLDYLLSAAQAGISRVFFHQGIGFKYNFVQPATLTRDPATGQVLETPLPPHIQPQYYAALIAAEASGASNNVYFVELSVNDPRIAAYAFYEGPIIISMVFIDSTGYYRHASAPGTRRSTHINLVFSREPYDTTASVKRLTIPFADDTTGLRWGGQTYETSTGLPEGTLQVERIDVRRGFTIQATEVVMLNFQA
ncbi:hypothetical protein BKA70DRAFT_1277653 [Coprinopsis sp. MPI-PUGE-AT-0042]|nr:hypothetical protein BKA70DRAFT_1277653 [Coprinopsis sp. MPI-PUGE-AT-0042]